MLASDELTKKFREVRHNVPTSCCEDSVKKPSQLKRFKTCCCILTRHPMNGAADVTSVVSTRNPPGRYDGRKVRRYIHNNLA